MATLLQEPSGAFREMRKCSSAMDPSPSVFGETIEIPCNEESLDSIKFLCKKVVPHWHSISLGNLKVTRISGGITNILFQVSPSPDGAGDPVIVRVFGPMTDIVIARQRELQALETLSNSGFGARLIARFQNGVVQSYIKAKTLTTAEMGSTEFALLIAGKLAEFHSLDVPGPKEPQLWPTLQNYLELAQGLQFDDESKQKQFNNIDFSALKADIQEVKEMTSRFESPVIFAHNDLLAGNIMFDKATRQLHLIDFEYSAYGYRGYDIANHFCEYAGFECDYSRYPDEEMQFMFFRSYLGHLSPGQVSTADLHRMKEEVSSFALVSHLFWAVWALIQARYSPIDFDFMGYFYLRYSEFKRLRAILPTTANGKD